MIKIENITPRKNVVKYETQKVIIPQQPFTEPTEIKQKIDEIGYLDFWIHKNSIKEWKGFDKYLLQDFF